MLDHPEAYLWLIPFLPLLASAITAFLGPRLLKNHSHWPCIIGAVGACFFSFVVFLAVVNGHGDIKSYYTWFSTGEVDIGFTLRADGLSAVMLVTVTFIGSLIAIYSIGYMHDDPGYARYFAEISLFLFAMTGLVLAENFILLYAFWEGVGLCSYLLIGFWFAKPSAAAAARKAFLVTRIGDVGFFIGIMLLWANVGYTLDFEQVFERARTLATSNPEILTAICLLLFCGAVGKSAQFPLHVWLPDAMEGPSSVSALIHAATMVTAGVYLVARCTPLFGLAPEAQLVVAVIGGFTALAAALMALTQTDLKRVLAYSTISQLGYMFLALGSATHSHNVVELGVTAAIFHLFTHAFFKALLFLGAGSVMHAMGNVIDMRKFGGLRKLMPHTHWTFLCGAGALAGLIPLAGFWSKDEILASSWEASGGDFYGFVYFILLIVGLVTAGLTAFYTARAYFLTFWGEEKIPPEAGHHAHESPMVMLVPLMILAAGSVLVGLIFGPTGLFAGVLHHYWMEHSFANLLAKDHHHGLNFVMMTVSTIAAVGGLAVAWLMYVKQPDLADKLAKAATAAYLLSRNRFYVDELYKALIIKPFEGFAQFCRIFDLYVLDQIVDLVGKIPSLIGRVFSPIQNGLVQFYALLMALGIAGFLVAFLLQILR